MNSLSLTGRVVSEPQAGHGLNGTAKATFEITTDGGPEGPLYFACVAFGHPATAAAQLKPGDRIFAAGKLAASRYAQAQSFVVNNFELLKKEDSDGK